TQFELYWKQNGTKQLVLEARRQNRRRAFRTGPDSGAYLRENFRPRTKSIAIAAATVPHVFSQSRPCMGVKWSGCASHLVWMSNTEDRTDAAAMMFAVREAPLVRKTARPALQSGRRAN